MWIAGARLACHLAHSMAHGPAGIPGTHGHLRHAVLRCAALGADAYGTVTEQQMEALSTYDYVLLNSRFSYR